MSVHSNTVSTGTQSTAGSISGSARDDSKYISKCHEAACWWLEEGYWPVVIAPYDDPGPKPGKRPIGGEGWGRERPTRATLAALYEATPTAGVGLLLGDPRRYDEAGDLVGDESAWLVDIEVDDEQAAAPVLARLFPAGVPATATWSSNRGRHWLFRGDSRLAAYGKTRITGEERDGRIVGNAAYLGVELRIGTIDPAAPAQLQSVIPPSSKADGSPREWSGAVAILALPDTVLADLDKHAKPAVRNGKTRGGARRPATGGKADPGPAEATAGNGEPKPPRRRRNGGYDRMEVRDWLTGDPDRFLDVLRRLGVQLTGRMTSEGWLECHAYNRPDFEASAGISPNGVYHDFATDESLPLFDLAAALRPEEYGDWQEACNKLGRQYDPAAAPDPARPPDTDPHPEAEADPEESAEQRRIRLAQEGSGGDPRRLANAITCELSAAAGLPAVAYFLEQWWEYIGPEHEGPVWRASKGWDKVGLMDLLNAEADRVHAAELARWQQQQSGGQKGKAPARPSRLNTSRLLGDVRAQLYPLLSVGRWADPARPFWIDPVPGDPDPTMVIALRNGLLDVSDPAAPRLLPPSPRFFSPVVLPFDYDPAAPRPSVFLDKVLARQWPAVVDGVVEPVPEVGPPVFKLAENESVLTLQEWFGYSLTADNRLQKMLILHGEPQSGRSTILGVLRWLLGRANCAEVDTKALNNDHGTEDLPGKLLVTFSDSRTADNSDNLSMLQFFLSVVGRDPVRINPKGRTPYSTELTAKVVMSCNMMPNLRDSSGAIDRRLLVLHAPTTVPDSERDEGLGDKLRAELPGILNWALAGRARLLERRRFVQPRSGLPVLEQARRDANHVLPFAEDCLEFGAGLVEKADDLRAVYGAWCNKHGLKGYSDAAFGRCLKDAARLLGGSVERDRVNDPHRRDRKLAVYSGTRLVVALRDLL